MRSRVILIMHSIVKRACKRGKSMVTAVKKRVKGDPEVKEHHGFCQWESKQKWTHTSLPVD